MDSNADKRRNTAGAGRLLELVRTGRADTRIALTRESGLARATVNDRLDLLLGAGLITDNGKGQSTGGRRAASFAFNEASGVVVVAVTVGVPGPVQAEPARVVSPPNMTGWDGVDIVDALAFPLDVPVLVAKDTNLMALGEHRASYPGDDHILVVKVGTGVGSGIICARALHRGAEGAAGDIGHIPVPGIDELCVCGKVGCVEARAGGWALARDLRALGHDVSGTRDVLALIRARDHDAMRLVNEGAKALGIAIADAVNVLNPSTVVLGGDIANAHEHLLAHVREVVYTRSLPLATRSLDIVLSELGNRAGVLGGANLAIEHRLHPDAVDRELERRLSAGAALGSWISRANTSAPTAPGFGEPA
jgi:predicted NBD/HSP70 family sugar kinase